MRHTYKIGREKPEFTKLESQVFRQLYIGNPVEAIAGILGIEEATAHMVCHNIRQKTGITDTRDRGECIEWLRSFNKPSPRQMDPRHATPTQLDCMELLVQGLSYEQIRKGMDFHNIQTAQNHISQGCKRAGITRDQIPAYFTTRRPQRAAELDLSKFNGDQRRVAPKSAKKPDPMDDPAFS